MYTGKWFSLISPLSEHALVLFYYDMLAAVLVFPPLKHFHFCTLTHTTERRREMTRSFALVLLLGCFTEQHTESRRNIDRDK